MSRSSVCSGTRGISQEFMGDALGEEFKGYVFKIMGGEDVMRKVSPMKQGILTNGCVRPFLLRGSSYFHGCGRRNGECRRKSVRGCIASPDLSVINLVIVKKREGELPDLTDKEKSRMRGPKIIVSKAPKIRRLLTPLTLQRKRTRISDKKERIAKAEDAEYQKLLASRLKEHKEKRSESLAKKRSRLSTTSKLSVPAL